MEEKDTTRHGNMRCEDLELGQHRNTWNIMLGSAGAQVHLWMWVNGDKGGEMDRGWFSTLLIWSDHVLERSQWLWGRGCLRGGVSLDSERQPKWSLWEGWGLEFRGWGKGPESFLKDTFQRTQWLIVHGKGELWILSWISRWWLHVSKRKNIEGRSCLGLGEWKADNKVWVVINLETPMGFPCEDVHWITENTCPGRSLGLWIKFQQSLFSRWYLRPWLCMKSPRVERYRV